ncbi:hypothetical protein [Serratia marcescens]|uniref:hypothetical protein n=1 Tax=Serratia marcescens TaxID=615 RepID=UPI000F7DDBCC|nr:hypothetical protein [Serratia marcescens]
MDNKIKKMTQESKEALNPKNPKLSIKAITLSAFKKRNENSKITTTKKTKETISEIIDKIHFFKITPS